MGQYKPQIYQTRVEIWKFSLTCVPISGMISKQLQFCWEIFEIKTWLDSTFKVYFAKPASLSNKSIAKHLQVGTKYLSHAISDYRHLQNLLSEFAIYRNGEGYSQTREFCIERK